MKRFVAIVCLLALAAAIIAPGRMNCLAETGEDAPELAEGAELRVMSFNILHPDWSRIAVNGRDEIVAGILSYYMPDVVALQEAGAKWHKALKPLLLDTGVYAVACRQSNAEGFIYNATCFLYNPATVKPVEEYILDLDYRDVARVFSVAIFERLSDGTRFAVTNTHPAPRDEPKKYERNMTDLTAFAAETAQKYADLPVIMAGDFNTPEQAEKYLSFMEEAGVQDAKYAAGILVRNYSTFFGYQVKPNNEDTDLCVDHIFVNDKVDVKLFSVVIGHDVQDASDHTPIYADIAFK